MINLSFIEYNGEKHDVEVEPGSSLMQAALDNAVPGIDADCGGSCACGTCHIKVAAEWAEVVGAPSGTEATMLGMTPDRNERSRLACQITLGPEMDGLVVELPEFQM